MKFACRPLLIWCVVIIVVGCGPSVGNMVPTDIPSSGHQLDQTVKIMPVTGTQERSLIDPYVGNGQFQQALLETLQRSNIFRSVQSNDGDLLLFAIIKQQDRVQPDNIFLDYRIRTVVEYRFEAASDQHLIWDKTYESEFGSDFVGDRANVVEGSIRENLLTFLKGLSGSWPG
jgi:hypothetical protein